MFMTVDGPCEACASMSQILDDHLSTLVSGHQVILMPSRNRQGFHGMQRIRITGVDVKNRKEELTQIHRCIGLPINKTHDECGLRAAVEIDVSKFALQPSLGGD